MRVAVDLLRERCALLKLQVLDLIVIVVNIANPELCTFIVSHVGLAVRDRNTDVHIGSGHNESPPFICRTYLLYYLLTYLASYQPRKVIVSQPKTRPIRA